MATKHEHLPLAAAVTPRLPLIESVDSTNAKLVRDAIDGLGGVGGG